MTTYTFQIGQLQADSQQGTLLTLHVRDESAELRVRVCPSDAQLIALALAGLSTPATRLAHLVRRLAEQLDARPTHLLLQRNSGSVIEASLVLASGLEAVSVPLTFGDAVVVALVNQLPLCGDRSLSSLVRLLPAEHEPLAAPPAAFAAFFDALEAE